MTTENSNKSVKVLELNNIETSLNEITNVESLISQIIGDESFDKLNSLTSRQSINRNLFQYEENYYDFISIDIDSLAPYSNLITEKEFLKIVEANKQRCYKTAGKYQQSLYSNYFEAKAEKDDGYISDVLKKAIIFQNNVNQVKQLGENRLFMKEWRKNFGKISPLSILKNTGSMKRINIIKRLSQ